MAGQGKARQGMAFNETQNILYVITDGQGFYKIGVTRRRAADRLQEGQTWNPHRLQVVYEFKLNSACNTEVEQWLHSQFQHCRTSGGTEWRRLTESQLKRIVEDVRKIENRDCDIQGTKVALVRSVHGEQRSETRTNRQSLLAQRSSRHATDQHLLGSVSRKYQVSCQDVLREKGEADRDGDQ
jgi:hypothetical protein